MRRPSRGGQNGSKWIRPEKRWAIYSRDGFLCLYCRCGVESCTLSIDHVVERKHGGENDADNLITACVSCNAARQAGGNRKFFAALRARGIDTAHLSRRIRAACRRRIDLDEGKRLVARMRELRRTDKEASSGEEGTQ